MKFVELTEEEFKNASINLEHANFYQTVAWANIKEKNGWIKCYVGIKDENDNVIGASLILKKKLIFGLYMGYAPRGFLIDFKDKKILDFFTAEIKKYGKKNKFIFIKIDPYYIYQERDKDGNIVLDGKNNKELVLNLKKLGYIHHGLNQNIENELQPRFISVLDIKDKTYDELYKDMRRGTRKVLRRSRDGSINIIEITEKEQLKDFKNLMLHTADRRGFIDRPLSYYENLYTELNNQNMIKILLGEVDFKFLLDKNKRELDELDSSLPDFNDLKEKYESRIKEYEEEIKENGEKKIVSAIMFILYNKEVVALLGCSYQKYMKYNAHYFIHDQMLKYATSNNYEKYNFYGITGNFNEDDPDYGLFYFKRGFDADVVELIGEFDLVINKSMYKIYKFLFKTYKKIKNIKNHIKD